MYIARLMRWQDKNLYKISLKAQKSINKSWGQEYVEKIFRDKRTNNMIKKIIWVGSRIYANVENFLKFIANQDAHTSFQYDSQS